MFAVLADLLEEDFRQETLPFLRGRARSQILDRRMAQTYRDTPFHSTASIGREASGRRDERVQMIALTNAQLLNLWLSPLAAAGVRVSSLHSPPTATPALLRAIARRTGAAPPRVLVVTVNRSGLRQTLIEADVPRFSRLAAVAGPGDEPNEFAANCLTEVNKTQQYLVGLRLIPRDARLATLIVAPPGHLAAWSRPGLLVDAVDPTLIELGTACAAAGLRKVSAAAGVANEDGCADALWAHVLAHSTPRMSLAPGWLREAHRLWQTRVGLWLGGAAVMLGGVAFGLERVVQADALAGEAVELSSQSRQNVRNYERIKAGFPPLPATAEQLKASVTAFEKHAGRSVTPGGLLAEIGQVLERAPELSIDRLEWLQSSVPEDTIQTAGARQGMPAAAGSAADAPPERFEIAVLHGSLAGEAASSPRSALDTAERIADALRGIRGSRVAVLRAPVDVSPQGRLDGTDNPGTAEAVPTDRMALSLRISRRIGPER
ncbi:MAG: hypothetical protein JNM90_05045 [Burkholderiales bacterium]|nr:hypothetical protein [Burkholderiales bacterium]